jgi:nitroimidazol reductase NimA-like FMN-containing flavoprotein (pyridoxamine 5'-phosphate oxidase superfamily)
VANPPSERTLVRRLPKRGAYDRQTIDAILDEGLVCHLGVVLGGEPRVLPTAYARDGDRLLLHGARTSASMRALAGGAPACVTVTLLDGLVLARSAFHHSMNYRSVVAYGIAREGGRPRREGGGAAGAGGAPRARARREARGPSEAELAQTTVVALPLDEASAKVRTGGPVDDVEDHLLRCGRASCPSSWWRASRATTTSSRRAHPSGLRVGGYHR